MTLVETLHPAQNITVMLRELADRIEAGEASYESVLIVGEPTDEDEPFDIMNYGRPLCNYAAAGMLQSASIDLSKLVR